MRFYKAPVIGLLGGASSVAAVGYADNQLPTLKDEPHVAANFPEIDMKIFSPAFLSPETVPAGFGNGTAGPIDQATLGMYSSSRPHIPLFFYHFTENNDDKVDIRTSANTWLNRDVPRRSGRAPRLGQLSPVRRPPV